MAALKIVLGSIVASVLYGVLHNQVSARLSLEYFTVAHPRLARTDDPTVHAILWGIIATWWIGAALGTVLALAARAGSRPKRDPHTLVAPIAWLLGCTGLAAAIAAALGHHASANGWVFVVEPLASKIPVEEHDGFIAALWMHLTSYAVGALGAIVLALRVSRSRRRAT